MQSMNGHTVLADIDEAWRLARKDSRGSAPIVSPYQCLLWRMSRTTMSFCFCGSVVYR